MQITQFVLCPDKSGARFVRRYLAEHLSSIHLQVGTWVELINLTQSSFCLPDQSFDWVEMVRKAMQQLEIERTKRSQPYTWSNSFKMAEEAVVEIIAAELAELLTARKPSSKSIKQLKPFKKTTVRYQQRLNDLLTLHEKMEGQLPPDLAIIDQVIHTDKEFAIRDIQVLYDGKDFLFSAWQSTLIDYLNDGLTQKNKTVELAFKALKTARGQKKTALNQLQTQLFSIQPKRIKYDSSAQFLAVRDPLEEVELLAYMIQHALKSDKALKTCEIALLLPKNDYYSNLVRSVFTQAGLPTSGLVTKVGCRDLGKELIYLFLFCRQSTATPAMAYAALLGSSLMPCSKSYANKLAQTCFNGENAIKQTVEHLDGVLKDIVELILAKDKDESSEQLLSDLDDLLNLVDKQDRSGAYKTAVQAVEIIRPYIPLKTPIDWPLLLKMVTPLHFTQEQTANFSQEGIAIFTENEMAWRPVKQLFVLGFVDGAYPQQKLKSTFFLEEEKQQLAKQLDLNWRSVEQYNHLKREVFKQQLSIASDLINFVIPLNGINGDKLAASASLDYIAQLFSNISSPDELIKNLDIVAERASVKGLPAAKKIKTSADRTMDIVDLQFDMDLLDYRKDKKGKAKPESPSGFETLMVSPLAWLFSRTHIESKAWEIQELDVMTMGSIAHKVFELLFEKGKTMPTVNKITKQIPLFIEQAALESAPFLNTPEWHIEKTLLVQETIEAAIVWASLLKTSKAEIVANEMALTGVIYGCAIRGFADCVFKLPGNEYIVVDYKKTKAQNRTPRMEKGYDLQASLYRKMISRKGGGIDATTKQISVMYYTLNDQEILMDKANDQLPQARAYGNIDEHALVLLKQRISELKGGKIKLNKVGDSETIGKETGITPYALDNSPLIGKFSHAAEETE